MAYEIRAASFAEILDTGFHLLRDHFTLLVGIGAVLYVPYELAMASLSQNPGVVHSGAGVITLLLMGLFMLTASPVVAAAITYAIGEVYLGRQTSFGNSLRASLAIFMPLAGTTLLAGLAVVVGLILLVIPGIYLSLAFMLIWQIAILERVFGVAALRRSRELMRGNLLRGFGVLFVGALIVGILGSVLQFVFGAVPLLGPVARGLVRAAGAAYASAVAVVLYFDIRCRKEAFDVERLARLVEAQGPVAAAPMV